MKRVYISHALWGNGTPGWDDVEANFERHLLFVAMALAEGHTVVSWAHHYLMEARGLAPQGPEWANFYLDRDLELLRFSDEMWLCCPVEVSNGARIEYEAAIRFGIPVLIRDEWLNPTYKPHTPFYEFIQS